MPDTGGQAASSWQDASAEADRRKRNAQATGFDEEEADNVSEPSEDGNEQAASDFNFDIETEEPVVGRIKRRRLHGKTNPSETGYTVRPLLKKGEHKIKMQQWKVKKRKQEAELKAARKRAVEMLAWQAPIGAFDENERGEVSPLMSPHASHRILALQGGGNTIYCKQCGYWSSRVKLRHLANPCVGLQTGNRSTLRLLECGIMPAPKANIPANLKLRHGCSHRRRRKSRW